MVTLIACPCCFVRRFLLIFTSFVILSFIPSAIAPTAAQAAGPESTVISPEDWLRNPILSAMAAWSELKYCAPPASQCTDLADDYSENNAKHLGYLVGSLPIGPFIAVYFDLDDYFGYTPEGVDPTAGLPGDGWVTMWVDAGFSLGFDLLPATLGASKIPREIIDDPFGSITLTANEVNALYGQCAQFNNDNPEERWECQAWSDTYNMGFSAVSGAINLIRIEVRRSAIDSWFQAIMLALPSGSVNSQILANNLINEQFASSAFWEVATTLPFRQFTPYDNGTNNPSFTADFTLIDGGLDINGDGRTDNYYPDVFGEAGILELGFQSYMPDTENYYVETITETIPPDWCVGSEETYTGFMGCGNWRDYEWGVAPGESRTTRWIVKPYSGASDGQVAFGIHSVATGIRISSVFVDLHTGPSSYTGPVISHTAPGNATVGDDIQISATVTSIRPIVSVRLSIWNSDTGDFSHIPMARVGTSSQFTAQIQDVQALEVIYRITAQDQYITSTLPAAPSSYFGFDVNPPPSVTSVTLTTDKSTYLPGEAVTLNSTVLGPAGAPVTGATMTYTVDGVSYPCGGSNICTALGSGNYRMTFPAPQGVRSYSARATASRSDLVALSSAPAEFSVYAPPDLGHDIRTGTVLAELTSTTVRIEADVVNIGTYSGTASESITLQFYLRDPSGSIYSGPACPVTFSLQKTYTSSTNACEIIRPSANGSYTAEVIATLNGYSDQNSSNNTGRAVVWVGPAPAVTGYSTSLVSALIGSTTPPATGTLYSVRILNTGSNSTGYYSTIDLLNNGSNVSDCYHIRIYEERIETCDSNNAVVIVEAITSTSVWFYVGMAGTSGVTYTPETATAPAGLEAYYRITTSSGYKLQNFNFDYNGPNDDYEIVSQWDWNWKHVSDSDKKWYLEIPPDTSPRTYTFWLNLDKWISGSNTMIIRKLMVTVQPKHDLFISGIVPNGGTTLIGTPVNIQPTLQNVGGHTEYGVELTCVVTGPNSYSTSFNTTIGLIAASTSQFPSFGWQTAGLAAGIYSITCSAPLTTDPYPSNNAASVTTTLAAPPALSASQVLNHVTIPQLQMLTLTASVLADGTPATGVSVSYTIFNNGGQPVLSGPVTETAPGTYQVTFAAPLTVGAYTVSVSAAKSGHVGAVSSPSAFSVVAAPPDTFINASGLPANGITDSADVALSWSGSSINDPINILAYSTRLDGGSWNDMGTATSTVLTGLSEGLHTFEVKTRETGGAEDPTPAFAQFTVDTIAPSFDSPLSSNMNVLHSGDILVITADLSEAAALTAALSSLDSAFNPVYLTDTVVNPATHIHTLSYPISALNQRADGVYNVQVYATDAAGSTTSASLGGLMLDNHAPSVISHVPAADTVNVLLSASIEIVFSEPMSHASVESAFALTPHIPGTFAWNNPKSVTYDPSAALACNTLYTVSIAGTASDVAGHPMTPVSWSFTTGCGPQILHTPVTEAPAEQPLTLQAEVDTSNPPLTVTLYYRPEGAASDSSVSMSFVTGSTYAGTIPAGDVLLPSLQYAILAQDANASTRVPESGYFAVALSAPLPAPTAPSPSANGQSSIQISWTDNATNETNYRVERAENDAWLEIATVSGTSYLDTNLLCGYGYTYRVRAYRAVDDKYSLYSTEASAVTDACLSAVAMSTTQIDLAWADFTTGETLHHVWRSPDGVSAWQELAALPTTTLAYSDTTLVPCTTYYYQVKSIDHVAGQPDQTNIASAATAGCDVTTLLAPLDGSVTRDRTPTFTWTPIVGAIKYQLEISRSAGFSTSDLIVRVNGTTYTPTLGLPKNAIHFWRVRVQLDSGWKAWSLPFGFEIDRVKPAPPVPVTPFDKQVLSEDSPTFVWMSSADTAASVFQLDDNVAFTSPVGTEIPADGVGGDARATSQLVIHDLEDGVYFWRVRALDVAGNKSVWGEVRKLRIDAVLTPAPTLLRPGDGVVSWDGTGILFEWLPLVDVDKYQIRIDDNGDFSSPSYNLKTNGTTWISPATADFAEAGYYWQVRARGIDGLWGPWSGVWAFQIDKTAPPKPQRMAPADGQLITDATPTFEWQIEVIDVCEYTMQISSVPAMIPLILSPSVAGTNFTPATPLPDGDVYWRVKARDCAGNWGKWSTTGHFTLSALVSAYPLTETFDSSEGFTSTSAGLSISGGKVNWSVSRNGGQQWIYRSIPAFSGDVRLTIVGTVTGATNNCSVHVGLGSGVNTGSSLRPGWLGCGTGTNTHPPGYLVSGGTGTENWDFGESSACVYWGNWQMISQSVPFTAVLTVEGSGVTLQVQGAANPPAHATNTYAGLYDTLFVGLTGDGDWPSCTGTVESVLIEPLNSSRLLEPADQPLLDPSFRRSQ